MPTAWAILALNCGASNAVIADDFTALRADMRQDGGTAALAWGLIALNELGEEDAGSVEKLLALQANDGSWNQNPYHTAVALVALHISRTGLFG